LSGSVSNSEQALAILREGPAHLVTLTTGLTSTQLHTAPKPEEWSANEVLSHLRACADVWGDRITRILTEDTPTLRAIDPNTWLKNTNYLELEFQPSLQAYAKQRIQLLTVLEPLPPEGWARSAIIKGAGKALERTVFFHAQLLARHELTHLKQIKRLAKSMNR
jgi:hypothetical protein